MHGRAAERVHAQLEAGAADGVHVDDVPQVVDVGQDEIFLVRGRRLDGRGERHALHAAVAAPQQLVGPVLDPLGHVGVGRAAVGRVVLEAAVLGRIVRRRDDDAVREVLLAAAVVDEDGSRDDRRRRHAVVALDDGLDPVGRQDLKRGALGRRGQRVRVLAHVERAVRALATPVVADGLGDGQDVGLGERAVQRRATMAAGAEADQLVRVTQVGATLEILPFKPGQVNQHLFRSRLARKGGDRHEALPFLDY